MTVEYGKVTGGEIKKNKDGTADRLLLQVEISDSDDVQTVEYFPMAGEDSNPVKESRVIVLSIGDAFKIAVGINDNIVPEAEEGEKTIYSDSGGTKEAELNLKPDSTAHLFNSADANIKLKPDGLVNVSNTAESLETLIEDLISEIQQLTTFGSPSQHFISSTSVANFETIKQRFLQLLGAL